MRKFILFIQDKHQLIYNLFLLVITLSVVVYVLPRKGSFKYEFQKGKPWLHEDYVAPFDFAILRSEADIETEKEEISKRSPLFFKKFEAQEEKQLNNFNQSVLAINDSLLMHSEEVKRARVLLSKIYQRGLIQTSEVDLKEDRPMLINDKGINSPLQLSDFYSLQQAKGLLLNDSILSKNQKITSNALGALGYSVVFDKKTTEAYLESQLNKVLKTQGLVQQGENIVFKGNIVDETIYNKLSSIRKAYEGSFDNRSSFYLVLTGQVLLVGTLLYMLFLFLTHFRPHILENSSSLTLVLFNLVVMVILAKMIVDYNPSWIYLTPFPILPIILRAFYDTRLALFVHIVTILLIGFLAPNGFEFVFLQFVAGIFSILTVTGIFKRAQLFTASFKITLIYMVVFLGFTIIHEGNISQNDVFVLGYFGINGFLSLFAFPLIYLFEKVFGLVSDVTLLELSDTNSPILRELSEKAPGTFQHSLQVANLAESATQAVSGNTLLVRTGALYHDIGKLDSPVYFVENQSTGVNPHDELSFQESAKIIIGHVASGVKRAKKANLPEGIIDFIRTHHGTSTVQYFYKQYIKSFPDKEGDLEPFSYPGPKPFSKETAILMMADSVEAASKSLKEHTEKSVNELVEKIINHQMAEGQFENADITLKEILQIKEIFKKKLMNIYHLRIEYPD